ncbi:carbohydrate kinase [Lapidilactobacillus concavus DSM 17758]|uniref:Carbohydrate kinase n=1 Tax=Lapidilactobacillus concavus DSM 17758 TaxID=1423735 RepID=A0A0R1VS80_9LACO|nr:FGGY-family carbohydrate kinase [Lapidilactobacillus concavus]KRM08608.1 carbohydrate kinase [Lapidilactobacillus concavus DSM 17758]GEL13760.1 L-ribulokinase [Lapidilactobacillus concavus]
MTINVNEEIIDGKTVLGIELGSTRIKAVLVATDHTVVASGSYAWENQLVDGYWTYSLEEVWHGIQSSYAELKAAVQEKYGESLVKIAAIGVSAMMHGYLPFDQDGQLLVPFRTWRNNSTAEAATQLTQLFNFNIPQRWSIAHLYQAILNQETHVKSVDFLTTLAGYVHWQLSGQKVIGIGDASGMFPIDEASLNYDEDKMEKFNHLIKVLGYDFDIAQLLPRPLIAGEVAGHLTNEGARRLDMSGELQSGSVMAPPEGDAGTGMTGTNSVKKRTGNISAGTSAFSMVVLDQPLAKVHRDIDLVTTPEGAPVAMVHTNNCTSDVNAWMKLLTEFSQLIGSTFSVDQLYAKLFNHAAEDGDEDAGGLVNYAYLSGENITNVEEGRPLFVRTPNSHFNLANFIKTQIFSAFAPLKIGMDILTKEEQISTDVLIAQGGLFRTPVVAQQILADALNTPITVMANAGEGGPWGMAILAQYTLNRDSASSLANYLDEQVFVSPERSTCTPNPVGVQGYDAFIERYKLGLPAEVTAAKIPDAHKK